MAYPVIIYAGSDADPYEATLPIATTFTVSAATVTADNGVYTRNPRTKHYDLAAGGAHIDFINGFWYLSGTTGILYQGGTDVTDLDSSTTWTQVNLGGSDTLTIGETP